MRDNIKLAFAWLGIALVFLSGIYGIYYLITYQRNATVDVQSRQWSYWAAIKYDTTESRLVSTESCSGTGNKRTCITSFHTEYYTVSHTRCEKTTWGDKLPPSAPDLSCTMAPGDYRRESVAYWLGYVEVGQKDLARHNFPVALWDNFRPGTRRRVVLDILGNVRELAKE